MIGQQILNDLDKKLWTAFERLWPISTKVAPIARRKIAYASVYREESNPYTWRLAEMSMIIPRSGFNFGWEPENSFISDQRTVYLAANPLSIINKWWDAELEHAPADNMARRHRGMPT